MARRDNLVVAGKYRLDRLIGQGAAGEVWLATHETIGKKVAVKLLRADSKGRSAIRFVQEARLAAQVQNRFVVSIHDFGNMPDGTLYMVMEHLYGETLGARLNRQPPLRVGTFLDIIAQALTGLEAVHRQGIVHRDLKPENMFLVEENGETFPKLLDFGVSRTGDASALGPELAKLTATGMTVGTPLYMSPEQARGLRDLDARSDIYAMGVILYRGLTGTVPFADSNVLDLLMKVVNCQEAPAVRERRPDLGDALSRVVQKAMAPSRDHRFPDAAEMRRALLDVRAKVPAAALCSLREGAVTEDRLPVQLSTILPREDVDPTMPARPSSMAVASRRRLLLGGAVGFAAAVMGAAVWKALSRPAPVTTSAAPLPAPRVEATPVVVPPAVSVAAETAVVTPPLEPDEAPQARPAARTTRRRPRRSNTRAAARRGSVPVYETPDF